MAADAGRGHSKGMYAGEDQKWEEETFCDGIVRIVIGTFYVNHQNRQREVVLCVDVSSKLLI